MIVKVPFYCSETLPESIVSELQGYHFNESAKLLKFNSENIQKIESKELIYDKAKKIFANKSFQLFIGGGHEITYPIVKAFSEVNANPGLIIFDAHPDCNPKFSTKDQKDLLLGLLSEKLIRRENIILVGVRKFDNGELSFLESNKIKAYTMREIISEGVHEICDSVMTAARNFGSLYLSIDIDVVDPAFAPGLKYPEPGGLSSRELVYFIQRIKLLKNLKVADICEAGDDKQTIALAAKIASELVSA